MYCKICGEKLLEADLICKTCGTKVPAKEASVKPEVIFNAPIENVGFSSKPKENLNEEFCWNVHDFSNATTKKPEPEEFVWDTKSEKFELPKSQSLEVKASQSETEIDKFFTLNKKSEDFQKLLDDEFEKISLSTDRPRVQRIDIKENTMDWKDQTVDLSSSVGVLTAMGLDAAQNADKNKGEEPAQRQEENENNEVKPSASAKIMDKAGFAPNRDLNKEIDAVFGKTAYSEKIANEKAANTASFKKSPMEIKDLKLPISGPDQKPKGRGKVVLRIIMVIIAIIVIIEAALLGIKYLMPESDASIAITNFQQNLSQSISNIFGGSDANNNGNTDGMGTTNGNGDGKGTNNGDTDGTNTGTSNGNPDGTNNGTSIITPDPIPMADKSALVTSQLINNKNIKEVKYNEIFAYDPKITYKDPDIATSIPITNNFWFKDKDAKPVYYDQSAVGTIIKFDSLWIDYVNTGKEEVVEITKPDTKARENVTQFRRNADLSEEFLLLEIGEIRQSSNYFYLWTHERIQVTSDGKSVTKDYKWIYQLEPVDQEMKIVNYYRY